MDTELNDEQLAMRDSVRRVMDDIATPDIIRALDREQRYPQEIYQTWVDLGLFRIPFAEALGGLGGSVIDVVVIASELARSSPDFYMAYAASIFCGLNIVRNGSPEQQRRWLEPLMSGAIKMSVSMSEPDAGSDPGAMRSVAIRDGDDYVLNGQKLWATGAGAPNNVINIYAKTDSSVNYRKGISLFLVDNTTPGLKMRKLDMLGRRCTGTYEILLDDVRVPAEALVGGENNGWKCLLSGLQIERLMSATGNVAAAAACLDLASNYAKQRVQFGRPIGSNQALAHQLADLAAKVEAADALTWRAARRLASGEDALREITMAKLFSSEAYVEVANVGMQVFGAYGYSMEFDMQRHYRDSRSATIAAGTSQMQRDIIAGLMGLTAR